MRDLRKKTLLESGKTVSRKARSRPESTTHSPTTSAHPSRAGSRVPSRQVSEEEDVTDSERDYSLASSLIGSDDDDDAIASVWSEKLRDRIAEILDRKRSSTKGRESSIASYLHLIRHHYADEQLEGQASELVPALLRSVRAGSTHEETVVAIKALAMTTLSLESESIYDNAYPTLKGACQDSEEESVKTEAIEALAIVTMCGGGSVYAAEELLEFLVEVIESDGDAIGAGNNGTVVTAALTAWAFVASHLDDLEHLSEHALEAFSDQLDSTDSDVQIAAGICIALVFEAAREHEEEEDEAWDMQYDQHKLMERMSAIARESSRGVSKKSRKQLHASFKSVLTSIEYGLGPGYSKATRGANNPHTGGTAPESNIEDAELGYREKIRFNNNIMTVDSWTLKTRLNTLRSVLGGGLVTQYNENPAVKELLSDAHITAVPSAAMRSRK